MIFAVSLLIYFSMNRIESDHFDFDRCRVSSNHESQLLAIRHLESSSVKYHNNNNSRTYHSYCNDQSKATATITKHSLKFFAFLLAVQAQSTATTNPNLTTTGMVVTSASTVSITTVTTTTSDTTTTTTCMLLSVMFLYPILQIVHIFQFQKSLQLQLHRIVIYHKRCFVQQK